MAGGDPPCAFQRDDSQMSLAIIEAELEYKSVTRLSSDERERTFPRVPLRGRRQQRSQPRVHNHHGTQVRTES